MPEAPREQEHHHTALEECCPSIPTAPRGKELFTVVSPAAAREALDAHLPRLAPPEHVLTVDALGRVLADALRSPAELPGFPRSTMDGFAVRAADTFGAG